MAIIQVPLEVPNDVALRIATGEFVRHGGVVRHATTGRLVKLLDDGVPTKQAQEALQAGVAKASTLSRGTIVIAASITVAAAVGAAVWAWEHSRGRAATTEATIDLQSSLAAYLEAARDGELNVDVVQRLIASIDAAGLEATPQRGAAPLAADESDALILVVADYTRRLAEANAADLVPVADEPSTTDDDMGRLRYYLELQERIFAAAA